MDIFYALADPTRRNILEQLAGRGSLTATDIAKKFPVSPPAVSQHLKVLRQANLVAMEKSGQYRLYSINPKTIKNLESWAKHLNEQWQEKFDRLDVMLEQEKEKIIKRLK